jgi:MFS family permease
MIGIFLPIYLYVELGFSLTQVILFFLVWTISFALFLFPAVKTISKYGAKHSMIASIPFMVSFLGLILLLQYYPSLSWIAAIIYGAEFAFFWMGFHIDAALQGKRRDLGKESGLITFLGLLPGVFGPLLGGLILYFFTFNILYGFVILIALVSFLPLLMSKEVYAKGKMHLKFDKKHMKYSYAYFSEGVSHITGLVFWPLFIFVILGSYLSLGTYGTVITIIVGLFTLVLGKWSDDGKRGILLKVFSLMHAVVWFGKMFANSVFAVFGFGTAGSVAGYGFYVPLLAKTYGMAKKEKVSYLFMREFALCVGRVVALVLVLITLNIKWAFLLTSIVYLGFFLFDR